MRTVKSLAIAAVIAVAVWVFVFMSLSTVHRTPRIVKCQANLHDIAMALKMYKEDSHIYPATLGGYVQRDKSGKVIPFENAKPNAAHGDGIYPMYIKSVKGLHCPMSPIARTDAVVTLKVGGKTREYYAYDSYDVYSPKEGDQTVGQNELRYNRGWAESPEAVDKVEPYPLSRSYRPPEIRNNDYKRQLRFGYPPDDTVVTWCSYHEKLVNPRGVRLVPVLFLSGQVDLIPAADVDACKWRTRPRDD